MTPSDLGLFITSLMDPVDDAEPIVNEMLAPHITLNDRIAWSLGWVVQSSTDEEGVWDWHHGRGDFTNLAMWSLACFRTTFSQYKVDQL